MTPCPLKIKSIKRNTSHTPHTHTPKIFPFSHPSGTNTPQKTPPGSAHEQGQRLSGTPCTRGGREAPPSRAPSSEGRSSCLLPRAPGGLPTQGRLSLGAPSPILWYLWQKRAGRPKSASSLWETSPHTRPPPTPWKGPAAPPPSRGHSPLGGSPASLPSSHPRRSLT